jgi:hypothetical protein
MAKPPGFGPHVLKIERLNENVQMVGPFETVEALLGYIGSQLDIYPDHTFMVSILPLALPPDPVPND